MDSRSVAYRPGSGERGRAARQRWRSGVSATKLQYVAGGEDVAALVTRRISPFHCGSELLWTLLEDSLATGRAEKTLGQPVDVVDP